MTIRPWPGMTRAEVQRRIDKAAQKRDHACDVLGKPLLGLAYQTEIDKWVSILAQMPDSANSSGPQSLCST